MAQVFWSRLATRAGSALGVAGLTVVALTPLGAPPAAALPIPDAYVANFGSGNVSVIKTSTNTVVKTVTVDGEPRGSPSPPTEATPMWPTAFPML